MKYFSILFFILLFSCFQPNLNQSDITISDDIQGQVPNALTFAIFGQGTREVVDEDDNITNISTLFILASSDIQICDSINQDPEKFFDDLSSADISGEFVTFKFETENPIEQPDEFSNNIETNFFSSNGIDFIVDAVNKDNIGTFNLLEIKEDSLTANFNIILDFDRNNFINPELNSVLSGRFFNASKCEGIDIFFSLTGGN